MLHSIEVGFIRAILSIKEKRLKSETIVAFILHDIIEDTSVTL
jgi:(p)ppGpp synthase/HD superfamily hydrolase